MAKIKRKLHGDKIIIALFAVLVVVGLVNVIVLTNISMIAGQKAGASRAAAEPAILDVTEIYVQDCSDCYDANNAIDDIKKQNTNVSQSRVEMSSDKGRSLIDKYRITKLPALVVTGEINKSAGLSRHWTQAGTVRDDAVVIEALLPYYSTGKNRVVGLVNVTRILDTSCAQCSSIDVIVNSFGQAGVAIKNDVNLEYNSPQGARLISDMGITRVPSIVVSGDILEYTSIAAIWPQLNATEKNGAYALHVLQAPYRDLALNRVVGLVDVIYLNDSSCSNCYNVHIHKQILSGNFGLFLLNETVVDINSTAGKAIVSRYNITLVPAFVMSPDAKYYEGMMQVWPSVGTQESDGWYAFRNVTVLGGIYKNLGTGKTVVPAG